MKLARRAGSSSARQALRMLLPEYRTQHSREMSQARSLGPRDNQARPEIPVDYIAYRHTATIPVLTPQQTL